MTDLFAEPEDATPLGPAERDGLKQSWITYRRDLNEAELRNILKAALWARRRRPRKPADLLSDRFATALHKRMFGDVWKWAGAYRRTDRNLGVDAHRIAVEVRTLLDDARYWVSARTYPADELAVRVHHRLVAIHPFPNGNGRHARFMADLLVESLGGAPFSWGGANLTDIGEVRARYIAALRAADDHDMAALVVFARS